MGKIRELCPTMSQALKAMLTGLEKQSKRSDFIIDMDTFGSYRDNICFGCVATCTLQEIAQKDFIGEMIIYDASRAAYLGFDRNELAEFELAIDLARRFSFNSLFAFYHINDLELRGQFRKEMDTYDTTPMEVYNWKKQAPKMRRCIAWLIKRGL